MFVEHSAFQIHKQIPYFNEQRGKSNKEVLKYRPITCNLKLAKPELT